MRVGVLSIGVPIVALLLGALAVTVCAAVRTLHLSDLSSPLQFVTFLVLIGSTCGLFFFWSSWPWTGLLVSALVFISGTPAVTVTQAFGWTATGTPVSAG